MRFITVLSTWVVLTLANGCAHYAQEELSGRQWMLVELNASVIAQDKTTPHIQFDVTKQSASGYAGCNRFQVGYTRESDHFKFGPIISTRMACVDSDALETTFLEILAMSAAIIVNNNVLEMRDNNNRVLARFKSA